MKISVYLNKSSTLFLIFMQKNRSKITAITITVGVILCLQHSVSSQILPDTSLVNPSKINKINDDTFINGGTKKGQNLFHSFIDFSVKKNDSVIFQNNLSSKKIFARISGGKQSIIKGTILTQNPSDLYLINPNGFIFDSNSKILLKGGFTATTANSIKFKDQSIFYSGLNKKTFKATDSLPSLLNFKENTGRIQIQGDGHNISGGFGVNTGFFPAADNGIFINSFTSPLSVSFIGSEINLDGGIIHANGNIYLGSIKNGGVRINNRLTGHDKFDFSGVDIFGDISLRKRSLINNSGPFQGLIDINSQNFTAENGSIVNLQNYGSGNGEIRINTSNAIKISGTDPIANILGGIYSESFNTENGASVNIKTHTLSIRDGGIIVSRAYADGASGDINVYADNVDILGASPRNPVLTSSIRTETLSQGDSGNIKLFVEGLNVRDGGFLSSVSGLFGEATGNAGDVHINAEDTIVVEGVQPQSFSPSIISSTSFQFGDSGDVSVNASKVFIRDSGIIDSSSVGFGSAGSILINAKDIVEVSGRNKNSINPSSVSSSAVFLTSGLFSPIQRFQPLGASGSVAINSKQIRIANEAQVSVRNDGILNAGSLKLDANEISITNLGNLNAATNGGDGGSILIFSGALLLDSGKISSTSAKTGLGGNIDIQTQLLATKGQSSIEANAENNFAGKVDIETTQLIARGDTRFSASSQSGTLFDGQVNINQGSENLNLIRRLSEPDHSVTAVTTKCTNKGEVSNHGPGINPLQLSELQQKALDLKQRLDIANQFTYLDHKTGERKPFKRWLGIQKKENGDLEMVFSPEQSKTLQNVLSSLNNICLANS